MQSSALECHRHLIRRALQDSQRALLDLIPAQSKQVHDTESPLPESQWYSCPAVVTRVLRCVDLFDGYRFSREALVGHQQPPQLQFVLRRLRHREARRQAAIRHYLQAVPILDQTDPAGIDSRQPPQSFERRFRYRFDGSGAIELLAQLIQALQHPVRLSKFRLARVVGGQPRSRPIRLITAA